jgi:hypothetical protein
MSESKMRQEFCKLIAALDPIKIENLLTGEKGVGTPDVEFVGGWAELKWLKNFPKREGTPIRLPHYTQEQRRWALRRQAAGEDCWLILQIGCEWWVFDADGAQNVGFLDRAGLHEASRQHFLKKPTAQEMCGVLRTDL